MTANRTLPAVVLPGMDGTGDLLRSFVRRSAEDRPVKLISYPQDPSSDYDRLIEYVELRLPSTPFLLIAESYSGPIAIAIAAKNPMTAGLVLSSTFAARPVPKWVGVLAEAIRPTLLPDALIAAFLLGTDGTPDLKQKVIRIVRSLPPELIRQRVHDVMASDQRAELQRVLCPVLLLHGRRDRLVRGASARAIAHALRCEVTWLDAPHMLLETHADAAARAIAGFSNRHGLPLSHRP